MHENVLEQERHLFEANRGPEIKTQTYHHPTPYPPFLLSGCPRVPPDFAAWYPRGIFRPLPDTIRPLPQSCQVIFTDSDKQLSSQEIFQGCCAPRKNSASIATCHLEYVHPLACEDQKVFAHFACTTRKQATDRCPRSICFLQHLLESRTLRVPT